MSITEKIAEWYLTNVATRDPQNLRDALKNPGANKVEIMLIGEGKRKRDNHLGYLWRFPRTFPYRIELLKRIANDELWNMSMSGFCCFEDLYNELWNRYKMKYINQLVIYDLALNIIYATGNVSLLPKEYVYVHALPLKGFGFLKKYSELKKTKKILKNGKIPFRMLTNYFPGLNASQLEDLFCYVGKSVRRVNAEGKGMKSGNTLDDIIEHAQNKETHR